jgi:hypothetical protein
MRELILAAGLLLCTTAADADPYPWCAQNKSGTGTGSNCSFMTFEQCQAAIVGTGVFCHRNTLYDGKPARTPEDGNAARRSRNRNRS